MYTKVWEQCGKCFFDRQFYTYYFKARANNWETLLCCAGARCFLKKMKVMFACQKQNLLLQQTLCVNGKGEGSLPLENVSTLPRDFRPQEELECPGKRLF